MPIKPGTPLTEATAPSTNSSTQSDTATSGPAVVKPAKVAKPKVSKTPPVKAPALPAKPATVKVPPKPKKPVVKKATPKKSGDGKLRMTTEVINKYIVVALKELIKRGGRGINMEHVQAPLLKEGLTQNQADKVTYNLIYDKKYATWIQHEDYSEELTVTSAGKKASK